MCFRRLSVCALLVLVAAGCSDGKKSKTIHAQVAIPPGAEGGELAYGGVVQDLESPDLDFEAKAGSAGLVSVTFRNSAAVRLNTLLVSDDLELQALFALDGDRIPVDETTTVASWLLMSPALLNLSDWAYAANVIPLLQNSSHVARMAARMAGGSDWQELFTDPDFLDEYQSAIQEVLAGLPTLSAEQYSGVLEGVGPGPAALAPRRVGRFVRRASALDGLPVRLVGLDFVFYTFYYPDGGFPLRDGKYEVTVGENGFVVTYPFPLDHMSWRVVEGIAEVVEVDPAAAPFNNDPGWVDRVLALGFRERAGLTFTRYSGTEQSRVVTTNNWYRNIDVVQWVTSWVAKLLTGASAEATLEVPMKIAADRPGLYLVRIYTGGLGDSGLGLGADRSWELGQLLPNIGPRAGLSRGQEMWIRALFLNIFRQAMNAFIAVDPGIFSEVLGPAGAALYESILDDALALYFSMPWEQQADWQVMMAAASQFINKITTRYIDNTAEALSKETLGAFKTLAGFAFGSLKQVSTGMQAAGWVTQMPFNPPVETFVIQVGDPFQAGPGGPWQSVAAGDTHTCAVREDGTAWCWGRNEDGELGDGTTTERHEPVQVAGLSGVRQVSAGTGWFSCAVLEDDGAWCWGSNDVGQLGDGTQTDRHEPVRVAGLSGVRQVSTGFWLSCALRQDGTVWCWGWNYSGQLGDGTTADRHEPVQVVGLSGVRQVSCGALHTCAVREDGTVWCWGSNDYRQLGDGTTTERHEPVQVAGLSGVRQVSCSDYHSCAVREDGTVWCWGRNDYGQLGDGTTTERHEPVQVVGLSDIRLVAAGVYASCAVEEGGALRCWGTNAQGAVGDGSENIRTVPVPVASDVAAVSCSEHTCVVKADGSAWCWGSNEDGELGDGTTTERHLPVQVLAP